MSKTKTREKLAWKMRLKILELACYSKSHYPHVGSCLSCIDLLLETIVFQMKKNDKFILSKGHASLAWYVILNHQNKITDKELLTYFKDSTEFGIHPPSTRQKDIPLPTGSLGHGLSFASGLAKAYMLDNPRKPNRVFCVMSDGECNEGAVWEAALFASHHKLYNLTVLIDKNKFQAFGKTKDVLGDAASSEKWKSFGFNVVECDGHNFSSLEKAFFKFKKKNNGRPNLIICNTIRGMGVKELQGKLSSNYTSITPELYDEIVKRSKNI
jgi:transketolase